MQAPPSTLSERLVVARTEAGLSQEDVAREIGMAQPSYSALETGKSQSTSKIGSLARLYGVDAYWLETGHGDKRPQRVGEPQLQWPMPPPRDQARTPEESRLLRLARKLDDKRRKALIMFLAGDQRQLAESSTPAAGRSSQDLSPADLSMAVQLANEKIASAGLAPTQEQYGEFVLLLHDLLVDGLPTADVHDIRSGKLRHSTSGDRHVGTEVQATSESPGAAVPAVHHAGKAGRKR